MKQLSASQVRVDFTRLPDLANELVGGKVCACDDDFFASSANLVRRSAPLFDPDAFNENGKIMDGWESQRGRMRTRSDARNCDHAVIELGIAGEIVGVNVDTTHFMRNAPRTVRLYAAEIEPSVDPMNPNIDWLPLCPRTPVDPNTHNLIPADPAARSQRFTHVRLNIYPDGGVARLRVHGIGRPADHALDTSSEVDLAALANGGYTIAASDEFFGGISNLLLPGASQRMDEGWETSRTRDRTPDEWVVVRLAGAGHVHRITVDTSYFKGNPPDSVMLEGVLLGERADDVDVAVDPLDWVELMPMTAVGPHAVHEFIAHPDLPLVDHVRLVIVPDGGVARLRIWGELNS